MPVWLNAICVRIAEFRWEALRHQFKEAQRVYLEAEDDKSVGRDVVYALKVEADSLWERFVKAEDNLRKFINA